VKVEAIEAVGYEVDKVQARKVQRRIG